MPTIRGNRPITGAQRFDGAHGVYKCTIRACPQYGREFDAMLPSQHRVATGRPIQCASCGDAVVLVRIEGDGVTA